MALIAPASPLASDALALARQNLRALGFDPVLGAHAAEARGYLAGSDDERAADINDALTDPSIRAILALRGGYGTMRILERIDYDAFASDPKVVMGYSDMTALLNALTQRSGVVTFHGPIAGAVLGARSRASILRTLCDPRPIGTFRGTALAGSGVARGILRGGNLSLIAHCCGTPFALDTRDAIVVFEDVDEAPYRIDRFFTQLELSGALKQASAFAIGDLMPLEVARERLERFGKPVVAGLPFGHIEDQLIVPIGLEAEADAAAGTLTIPEAAVE